MDETIYVILKVQFDANFRLSSQNVDTLLLPMLTIVSPWRNAVNSEIFARVLFARNFAYEKFRDNKPS